MNYLIVDFDSILYAACVAKKEDHSDGFEREEEVVISKIHNSLNSLFSTIQNTYETPIDAYKLFITGRYNWRKLIYPPYKANRKKRTKPHLLSFAKEYAVKEMNAFEATSFEADDLCIACKVELEKDWDNTIITASLDKDLFCMEGLYFDLYHTRYELVSVSKEQHLKLFYFQLLVGDTSDNIPNVRSRNKKSGIGKKGAEKILKDAHTEFGFRKRVFAEYLKAYGKKAREKYILNHRLLTMTRDNCPIPETFEVL